MRANKKAPIQLRTETKISEVVNEYNLKGICLDNINNILKLSLIQAEDIKK